MNLEGAHNPNSGGDVAVPSMLLIGCTDALQGQEGNCAN